MLGTPSASATWYPSGTASAPRSITSVPASAAAVMAAPVSRWASCTLPSTAPVPVGSGSASPDSPPAALCSHARGSPGSGWKPSPLAVTTWR